MTAPGTADAPSLHDPFVRGASELIGGPIGRRTRPVAARWWTPVRVVIALMVLGLGIGYAQKAPCLSHAWANDYQYTRMCYSDVYALYYAEGLDRGQVPYADHPVEYPVVIGGLMEVASWVSSHGPTQEHPRLFFDVTALLLGAGGLVLAWTTVRLAGARRPWDAAMVALAPVLFLHAYTNWDLAAAAFVGAAMWAWAGEKPGWAGVLIGLGVATKLYPLLLLGVLLLLCLRAGRMRQWLVTFGAAAAAWVVVDLPVWAAWPDSFGRFYALNRTRPADWDSLWFAVEHWIGHPLDQGLAAGQAPATLNTLSGVALLLALAAVTAVTFTAARRPRVAQVLFLALVAFLLTSKVYSPQYAIWLLPVTVLARPRWPAFLAWQASEIVLLFTRFYFFVGHDHPGQGLPEGWFIAAVVVRDAMLVLLAALVVHDIRHPRGDVVRAQGDDDPAGGVLRDAPDRFALAPGAAPAQA